MKHLKLFEELIRIDKHGKNIVWERDDYFICVNDIDDATFITLWYQEKKVGVLSLSSVRFYKGEEFYKIDYVEVDKKHRGSRLGVLLYVMALKHLPSNISGLYSYSTDRAKKNTIFSKFKYVIDEDYEDSIYIYK